MPGYHCRLLILLQSMNQLTHIAHTSFSSSASQTVLTALLMDSATLIIGSQSVIALMVSEEESVMLACGTRKDRICESMLHKNFRSSRGHNNMGIGDILILQ